jgi:hypothetical protein
VSLRACMRWPCVGRVVSMYLAFTVEEGREDICFTVEEGREDIWADGLYMGRWSLYGQLLSISPESICHITVIYTHTRTHQHLAVYLVRATSVYVSIRLSFRVHGDLPGILLLKNRYFSSALIMWASAIFSAFVDNIPFTATMLPIMMQLAESVGEINARERFMKYTPAYVSVRQNTSAYVKRTPFCW